jgi:hypothetical protein
MAVKKEEKKILAGKVKTTLKKPAIKKPIAAKPVSHKIIESVEPVEVPKIEVNIPEVKSQSSVDRGSLLLGATLLVIGAIWILGQYLHIPLAGYLWPFAILLPGIFIFISAVNMQGNRGEAFAIVGSILTSLGLLLFIQMITRTWASWSYAWALIAPTSIGIGQMLYGRLKNNSTLVKNGWQVAKVGLIIFAIGFVFFELIIGLNGFGLRRFGLPVFPVLIISAGVLILIRAFTYKR